MENSARYTGESVEPREGLAPVIVAVSRDSRTSWRTRTPRLYLHCTLAGPRRGNLEGKREQCHARSGAYMRISVRWPGNRHLRIVGCCAEAATLAEQRERGGGSAGRREEGGGERETNDSASHCAAIGRLSSFPEPFFISFLLLRRHHRRPPHSAPSIATRSFPSTRLSLFISLALASSSR